MGTKNNPGKYDCYTKAGPDEPIFVLRAKDPLAPAVIRFWISGITITEQNAEKIQEANDCANNMEQWRWGYLQEVGNSDNR